MDSSRAEEKRKPDEGEEDEEEDDYDDEADKRMRMTPSPADKKRSAAMGAGSGPSSGWGSASCQADNCSVNMDDEKRYHRRHKVCQNHANATAAVVAGIQQRFCQQCSRFHELAEFDQAKKSCRRRLAGHNERRRKSSYDYPGESSS